MPQILIFIQGDRFLRNKMKINLLSTKKPALNEKIRIFTS